MSVEMEKKLTSEQIDLIRKTIAKGATENELKLFIHLSEVYGLDPFKKEIFFIKDRKGENRIFTGRDGFLQIAHRSGKFNGMTTEVRRED
ncbi:MAG: recombinase RecT, partial [Thermoplasmata archaeon]|nr:recombinase RecT [Thermoplasmata archaeon]